MYNYKCNHYVYDYTILWHYERARSFLRGIWYLWAWYRYGRIIELRSRPIVYGIYNYLVYIYASYELNIKINMLPIYMDARCIPMVCMIYNYPMIYRCDIWIWYIPRCGIYIYIYIYIEVRCTQILYKLYNYSMSYLDEIYGVNGNSFKRVMDLIMEFKGTWRRKKKKRY